MINNLPSPDPRDFERQLPIDLLIEPKKGEGGTNRKEYWRFRNKEKIS